MKNIKNLFNVHISTYILILSFLFTGLIKNIILIYFIVIFHELGHIFIVKLLGYKVLKVNIYPSGGLTKIDKKINTRISHDILIASFGIVFQIVLYIIFYYLFKFSLIRISTYKLFLMYNTTILLFNLLPITPLDGYKLFRCFMEVFCPFKKAFYLSVILSIIFIILFITYNHLFSLNNYLIVSFLIYKLINELKNFKYENYRFMLERYLNDFPYQRIRNEKKLDLSLLKKDTYHYFKKNNTYISEKKFLTKKFSLL